MTFAQRVENVITYAVIGLIDWVAFHRCALTQRHIAAVCATTTPLPLQAAQLSQEGKKHETLRHDGCAVRARCRSVYLPLSVKHGIDLGSREALRRGVMHLFNIDFALEWPRALPPNVKLVGPLMPQPPKALPADLQVHKPTSEFPHTTSHAAETPQQTMQDCQRMDMH